MQSTTTDAASPQTSGAPSSYKFTIAIASAVAVVTVLVLIFASFRLAKWRKKRNARNGTAQPEMVQTTTTVPARRPRRPRRQPSTQTVPEYSEQAGDEEMVLDKAEKDEDGTEDVRIEIVSPVDSAEQSFASSSANLSTEDAVATAATRSRSAPASHTYSYTPRFSISHTTLHDIENPAPELRMDRVDTHPSLRPPSLAPTLAEQARLMAGNNDSTLSLDEVPLDGLGGSNTGHNRLSSSTSSLYFASPAYANRNRSRSIDITRTMSAMSEEEGETRISTSAIHDSAASTAANASTSGANRRSLMARLRGQGNSHSLLPMHADIPVARREALRNRDISAPIGETLVRSSYVYPKAGINPLQAAWLGARDQINRLTTYLDTSPPTFAEEDQQTDDARAAGRVSTDEASLTHTASDSTHVIAELVRSHSTRSTVLSELEQESAQLSSLVHQQSLRRASLQPHLIALPESLPTSPISPATSHSGRPFDWPSVSRSVSVARAHSGARRTRFSLIEGQQHSPSPVERKGSLLARRRVQSERGNSQAGSSRDSLHRDQSDIAMTRSDSPTPLSKHDSLRGLSHGTTAQQSDLRVNTNNDRV